MKVNQIFTLCLFLSFIIITEEHHSYHPPQNTHSSNKRHHTFNYEHKKDIINKSHNHNTVGTNNYQRYINITEPHHPRFQRNERKIGNRKRHLGRTFNFNYYKQIHNVMSFMYNIVSIVLIGIIALVLFSIGIRAYNNWFLNYQRKQFEKYQVISQQSLDQRNVCNNNILTGINNNLGINNLNQRVHYIHHSGISS